MTKSEEPAWLRKRLDVIIQLLLETGEGAAKSTTSKIERLLAMGFSQAETAQVIGKKPNYVSAIAGQKKKGSAKGIKKTRSQEGDPSPSDASSNDPA